jgi:hypothetical protein
VNSDCTDYLLVRPRGKRLGRFALDAQLAEGGRDGLLAATREAGSILLQWWKQRRRKSS